MPTYNTTYIAPNNCTSSLGNLQMFNGGGNSAIVTIGSLNVSCTANAGSSCIITDIPYGTYIVEVFSQCTPLISNVSCNGQVQNGNGTLYFNITTDSVTPNIIINIACS